MNSLAIQSASDKSSKGDIRMIIGVCVVYYKSASEVGLFAVLTQRIISTIVQTPDFTGFVAMFYINLFTQPILYALKCSDKPFVYVFGFAAYKALKNLSISSTHFFSKHRLMYVDMFVLLR